MDDYDATRGELVGQRDSVFPRERGIMNGDL